MEGSRLYHAPLAYRHARGITRKKGDATQGRNDPDVFAAVQ